MDKPQKYSVKFHQFKGVVVANLFLGKRCVSYGWGTGRTASEAVKALKARRSDQRNNPRIFDIFD